MSAVAAARELRSFLRRHGSRSPGAARAVLAALAEVVPADCVALSVADPTTGGHRTLASSYPDAVTGLIDTRMHTDRLFTVVRDGRHALRVRDLEPPRRRGEIFERIIVPQGFRDGVTLCLVAGDGRYVGMLNASTLDARHPDDDTIALLELLGPDLAAALDPVPAPVTRTGALGPTARRGCSSSTAAGSSPSRHGHAPSWSARRPRWPGSSTRRRRAGPPPHPSCS